MTIPATITAALDSLQAQVTAAQPLRNASQATKTALKLNAGILVANVQAALIVPSVLDTYVAPGDPAAIVGGVLTIVSAAFDQSNLSLMRGVTGRAASNLNLL